ncbi:hypothetical protein ACP4OV_007038 [Aristida adscensionis]
MSSGQKEQMQHSEEVRQSNMIPLSDQQYHEIDEFSRRRQEEMEEIVDIEEKNILMTHLLRVINNAECGGIIMSPDTPPFLAKLYELFTQELYVRAWICAKSHDRCIILESDIVETLASTESYGFLRDMLHRHMDGIPLIVASSVVVPSSLDLEEAILNNRDVDYSANMVHIMDMTTSVVGGKGTDATSAIAASQCESTTLSFPLSFSFAVANNMTPISVDTTNVKDGSLAANLEQQHLEEMGKGNQDTVEVKKGFEHNACEGENNSKNSFGDEEIVNDTTLYNYMEDILKMLEEPLLQDANHDLAACSQPNMEESVNDIDLNKITTIPRNNTTGSK